MNGVVIAVSTANRPEILNRCIAAAVSGCGIARRAHWIVVDDLQLLASATLIVKLSTHGE